ncbi:hypothetical protein EV193_105240 [Herbihabitans rhizosphaerae]|uniref:Small secreted domain DUF320 n=1 Tax=Herbihabitans rhizosphaerae TaxID=1872711 RepID=A0A4Q7KQS5_9PSEU|nr:hypothetical protein [Herbihabitans rhizosphaerae]RZS37682.1 hypothetical protein EV193_105240 [Herbihabitans rhizosphaerae]
MRARAKTFSAAMALVVGLMTAGLLASSGTANAAQPIVVGDCSTSINGTPGQPVSLSPSAVLSPVVNVARAVPLIGDVLAGQVSGAFASLPAIPIGALPNGNSYITGGTIGTAVGNAVKNLPIPLLGGVVGQVFSGVQSTLSRLCGIAVSGANAVTAPIQNGTGAIADQSQQMQQQLGLPVGAKPKPNPGTPPTQGGTPPPNAGQPLPGTGAPGMPAPNFPVIGGFAPGAFGMYGSGFDFGRSPMADYSSIPFATPGAWAPSPAFRYGGGVPGYSPTFGILGNQAPPPDGVQAAGHAEALEPLSGNGKVALPVLLAVLALSGLTAALVRTWVLRRSLT